MLLRTSPTVAALETELTDKVIMVDRDFECIDVSIALNETTPLSVTGLLAYLSDLKNYDILVM